MRLRPGNPSKQIASGLKSLAKTPSRFPSGYPPKGWVGFAQREPCPSSLIDTLRAVIKGGAWGKELRWLLQEFEEVLEFEIRVQEDLM